MPEGIGIKSRILRERKLNLVLSKNYFKIIIIEFMQEQLFIITVKYLFYFIFKN